MTPHEACALYRSSPCVAAGGLAAAAGPGRRPRRRRGQRGGDARFSTPAPSPRRPAKFEEALALDPGFDSARRNLATALATRGQEELRSGEPRRRARTHLERAAELAPAEAAVPPPPGRASFPPRGPLRGAPAASTGRSRSRRSSPRRARSPGTCTTRRARSSRRAPSGRRPRCPAPVPRGTALGAKLDRVGRELQRRGRFRARRQPPLHDPVRRSGAPRDVARTALRLLERPTTASGTISAGRRSTTCRSSSTPAGSSTRSPAARPGSAARTTGRSGSRSAGSRRRPTRERLEPDPGARTDPRLHPRQRPRDACRSGSRRGSPGTSRGRPPRSALPRSARRGGGFAQPGGGERGPARRAARRRRRTPPPRSRWRRWCASTASGCRRGPSSWSPPERPFPEAFRDAAGIDLAEFEERWVRLQR